MSEATLPSWKVWLLAIRPKTLPAAISPVLVGTAAAYHDAGFNLYPALAAMIGALLLQILSNLANDYYDFVKGVDTGERTGPQRMTASGMLTTTQIRQGIVVTTILAMITGLYLIYVGGIPILVIGIFSIIFAILYSGGPYPLSSIGLGDVFVFIFFGLAAVGGTYYVQTLEFSPLVLLIATPTGLIITAILVVNNYRDIETDSNSGKFTLAIFMGYRNTRIYFASLLIISYIIPIILYLVFDYSVLILATFLSLYHAKRLISNVNTGNEGRLMNMTLGGTAKLALLFSSLLSIGLLGE